MDDATRSLEWRDLVEAIPGRVGVQVGEAFAHVTEEFAAAVGTDPDTLLGEPWQLPFAPSEVDRLEREAMPAARSRGEWEGTIRAPGEDGRLDLTLSTASADAVVWTIDPSTTATEDPSSTPIEDSSSTTPVNPKTVREGRLRERPGFGRVLLDAVDDVFYVIDEAGEFHLWNDALAETTGYDHEEIAGMHPMELIPEDQHEYVPGIREAIEATEDRRVDVDILTAEGERITHEFQGTTFEDPETGEHFRCGLARDVTETRHLERELRRQRTLIEGILNTIPDVVFAFDEGGEPIVEDAMLDTFAGYSGEELADMSPFEVISEEDRSTVMDRTRDVLVDGETVSYETAIVAKDGERIPHEFRAAPLELDGEILGVVGSARDITERLERKRSLERQRDELATLDRMNRGLLETTREVIQTASREAVERAVCERLADSDLYRFAWVGEREFDGDRVVPRVSAGEDDGYLDAVTITADECDTGWGPAGRAFRTGDVQVMNVDEEGFEPWSEEASRRGFESVAAVPLQHDGAVYGVLVIYATRGDAFSPREQAGFDVLGRSVGSVIHAARSRELLFADTVIELEFRIEDDASPYVRTAADLDCELSLEGYVSSGGRWVLYLDVSGASPEAVAEAFEESGPAEHARSVRSGSEASRIELVVGESSLLDTVTAAGATVRKATVDAGGIRLTVDAPRDADVRGIVDRVTDEFPDSTLLATRERDREITTVGRPGGVLDELTGRQHEVLQTAYRAGYFAWPRESTAEQVATALDLTAPTLYGHLRKAERTILSALLGDR